MIRNPKDQAYSFFKFVTGLEEKRYLINGDEIAKTWPEHFNEVYIGKCYMYFDWGRSEYRFLILPNVF